MAAVQSGSETTAATNAGLRTDAPGEDALGQRISFGRPLAVFGHLFRCYPRQTLLSAGLLGIAALLQGIGFMVLVPVLGLAVDAGQAEPGPVGQAFTDALAVIGLTASLPALVSILILGFFLRGVFMLLAGGYTGAVSDRVATDFRLQLLRAVMGAKLDYYLSQPHGAFVHLLGGETKQLAKAYSSIVQIYGHLLHVAVYGAAAALVSWKLALGAACVAAVVITAFSGLVRMARRDAEHATVLQRSLQARLVDGLGGLRVIRAMAAERGFKTLLDDEVRLIDRCFKRITLSATLLKVPQELIAVVIVSALLYLGVTVWQIAMPVLAATIVLFERTLHHLLVAQLLYQRTTIATVSYWLVSLAIRDAAAAAEVWAGRATPRLEAEIVFDGIELRRDGRTILEDVRLSLPPRGITLLVGPSGAGKSSLLDTVTGLLLPARGDVLIGGHTLSELDMHAYRSTIGYVPQELVLLPTTVRDNVALGDEALDDDSVRAALGQAGALSFVAAMPGGILANVGDGGAKLSGGQRQRIMLARALVRRPRLLILDEPTTALDPVAERALCLTLQQLSRDAAILIVSHQANLQSIADRVWHVQDGRVTKAPTPTPAPAAPARANRIA